MIYYIYFSIVVDFPSVTFDGTFLHGGQHETQMEFVKVKVRIVIFHNYFCYCSYFNGRMYDG